MEEHGLSLKQKAFADIYMENANPGRAYIEAGYTVKNMNTAYACGHRLLKNAKVQAYINRLMSEKDNERIASADEVLELLTQLARGDMDEEMIVAYQNKATWEVAKRQAPPKDRAKALELLGKRYSLYTEKQQIDVTADVQSYVAKWGDDE